ncbi:PAS domain S-box protein [Cryomorpha ignava]|uniref:histidine kinase n=1 Tax=Cryomorpha ignava TaxID=101383 RepID=A0A7K3WVT7_9FLAO|nr:PAS domain S-box protein [Cryomorpha ignava]NEN25626.1 PAS domain S-box protein [Cryomorpha ignava]
MASTKSSSNTKVINSQPFLKGGGKMGELVRHKNWTGTPLGDPDRWHHSLKTMVAVMLNNPFGNYIAWGREFTQIYNDGYIPIIGKNKHPDALGISSKVTFGEFWHIIEPLYEKVMNGEAVSFEDYELQIDRNGYPETVYFDFSYSPIFIDNGDVGGILVTVVETTEKKKTELALKESNSQLEFAIEAGKLGTFEFNPATNIFSANDRFKKWHGLSTKGQVNLQDAIDAISESERENVIRDIKIALEYEKGGQYDIIYTLQHPNGKRKRIVRAKGRAWFNEQKEAFRFNGTLQDITESEINARKLVENERHLRLIIDQAPVAIGIFSGSDLVIEMANSRALKLWGRTEKEIIGIPIRKAIPELVEQGIPDLLESVYATEVPFRTSEKLINLLRDGNLEPTYISFSFEPIYDSDENVRAVMAMGIDVTEQILARLKIEESGQRVKNVIDNAPFPIGVYIGAEMKVELANQSIIDAWGKGNDVIGKSYKTINPELENQGIFKQLDKVYTEGEPFRARNQSVNIETDGELKPFFFNYEFTPLYDTKGSIYGIMNTAADVTDLNLANIKLEESERRFRESVKQAPLGIAIVRGEDFVFELANETYLQIINREEEEVLNQPIFTLLPEVRNAIEPTFKEVFATGVPFHAPELPVNLKRNGVEELTFFNLTYHPLIETNNLVSGIMVIATEVTDAVNAKKTLAQSEQHFRSMVRESPMAMTVLRGDDLVIEMANSKMLNTFWQKTQDEVIGRNLLDVFPELHEQKYPQLLKNVLKDGKKQSDTESVAIIKHGEELKRFYIDFEYAPLLDEAGLVSGIIVTANDVTSKIESRKSLENAEERIRIATEATELATWELYLANRTLVHSPRLSEIFGQPADKKISYEAFRNQIFEDDVENVVKRAMKVALATGIYKYEARILKINGKLAWISVHGKVFFDDNENPLNIIGTVRDITVEMLQQKALEDSEQTFRTLANTMPQFVWTSDPKGNLTYFNNSVYDYSGMNHTELLGGGWINMVHADDRERNIEVWLTSMKSGVDFLFEHRFERYDGEYRWQLSRAIPQKDRDGNILMWVGASTDIQKMKELEEQKDFFIGMASHELKTPVTSIKGYVQILQSMYSETDDEFLINSLNIVDRQIITLTSLISDLLDLSKIKSGHLVLNKSTFSVNEFLREYISEIQQINSTCSIFFKESQNREVFADKERLGQVLINFLTNAIKYSNGNCDVFVVHKFEKESMTISVRDLGIGISKKNQKKIFERFYRVEGKDEKTYPGFGIGLNIAAEIIERHKGKIRVESEPGKGSTFSFSIPTDLN